METFTIEVDADGIAIVTFDVPGRKMNTLTLVAQREVGELAARIAGDERIRGAVIRSGKSSGFCAGADLADMLGEISSWREAAAEADLQRALDAASLFSRGLRSLETCGKPVAVAVEGLALGGGLEFVLACHHRVAVDDPALLLSLPEAGLGLMPGAGATQRLPRLLGINAALPYLLDNKALVPEVALEGGVLHAVAPAGQVVEAARQWVLRGTGDIVPWDRKEFRLPFGGPHDRAGPGFSIAVAARQAAAGDRYPAIGNILRAVYEGSQVPIDAALRIESRYFLNTARSAQAQVMIRTFFTAKQALARLADREPMEALAAFVVAAGQAEIEALLGEGIAPAVVRAKATDAGLGVELIERRPTPPGEPDLDAIERRLLYTQAIAAADGLDRGLASDPRQIDADAIRRGFPRWTGGPLSFIDLEGPKAFLERAGALAIAHPGRFQLSERLRDQLVRGESPYEGAWAH